MFLVLKRGMIWKQPNYPSTDEWTRKMWHIYMREYYSAIKKYEILPFATTWIDLGGFLDSSVGKESACNAGDPNVIPRSGRSPREGTGYPLQYSWASLEAHMVKKPLAMWKTWV